jgi:hypothetical protein
VTTPRWKISIATEFKPGHGALDLDAQQMMATSNSTPANDDFHRLLLVVKDLAQQLDENRQAATKLKLHADLLKVVPLGPALNLGTPTHQ